MDDVTMIHLIEQFGSQDQCDTFRKTLGDSEWQIYWKDTGGKVIRESEYDDHIGNKHTYVTIQLCDWFGWNEGEIREHKYSFAVFLYVNGCEDSYNMFDTIEEAYDNYKKTCEKVEEIIH